jgi:two-component system sensor histidine kinase AlgZ
MHPILGNLRRLAMYLLAWIPLTAILTGLLKYSGGMDGTRAFIVAGPLCVVYAFVCLGTWYLCKATPAESTNFSRLQLTHFVAAVVISGVWVMLAKGLAELLTASSNSFAGLDLQVQKDYPLLFASGFLLYLLAVALHYIMLSQDLSRQAEQREAKANLLARDSELKALKAQVNPHFLFNSLNSISALTTVDAKRAREMCILLADFLRSTLGLGEKTAIPVSEELQLVRSFLAVEKVRFGHRMIVQEYVDPQSLDCMVPPLLLQPLAENAVNHGVSNLLEGGWIKIEIKTSGTGDLSLVVENNFDRDTPPRRGTGTGLKNVRQRLETRFGPRGTIMLDNSGDIFRVELTIPAERSAP